MKDSNEEKNNQIKTHIQTIHDRQQKLAADFRNAIDVPASLTRLDLESRKDDKTRQFMHIHQNCWNIVWDLQVSCMMRTLLTLDSYLALYNAKVGLALYYPARSMMELHGLILNIHDRLNRCVTGETSDWYSRGESFFKYANRARYGTRDPELIKLLVDTGVSKKTLEPIHSKDCEEALFSREEFREDRTAYARLCDYVHTNSQGFFAGVQGHFESDHITTRNGQILAFPVPTLISRYQYPVDSGFLNAAYFTSKIMDIHSKGALSAIELIPRTPYSEPEIERHTGTSHGFTWIPCSSEEKRSLSFKKEAIKAGRNDPCPCGSGKKYKYCHLNSIH